MRWIQEVRLLTVEVVQRAGNKIIIIYSYFTEKLKEF